MRRPDQGRAKLCAGCDHVHLEGWSKRCDCGCSGFVRSLSIFYVSGCENQECVECADEGRHPPLDPATPFVVKVQLSLHTSEKRRQVLVYDKTSRVEWQGDATVDVTRAMRREPKAFFWATRTPQGQVELHDPAPWQDW